MEITCLSVPNPQSYLLCSGIQDVENRGFGTDYRGRLYIHSSGRHAIRGMPAFEGLPVPVIHEFNAILDQISALDKTSTFIGIADAGVRVFLKMENSQPESIVNEYALLSAVYNRHLKDPNDTFFHAKAIIGHVDVVDVVQDSPSPWAEAGCFHWILRNPELLAEHIPGIRTTRTGLWKYELLE